MRLLRALSFCLFACTVRAFEIDDFLDRLDTALTISAFHDNFRARLAPSIASVGAEPKVRQVNGLFRVFVGPYGSRDDAKRIADRLRDALGLSSTIAIH